MSVRNWFYTDTTNRLGSVGFLLLRLVMGTAFLFHGWSKIRDPFGWMPAEMGIPGFFLALAALAEFGGGLALIVGFLTRLASLGIASVMIVAAAKIHIPLGHPFVSTDGPSYELAAVYLACALLFLLAGPGRYSLDACLFGCSLSTNRDSKHERSPA